MLDDGVYDGIVVDAEEEPGPDAAPATVRIDVVILGGPHKGELVAVQASGLGRDPLDLLGDPVTLTVAAGEPRIAFDL